MRLLIANGHLIDPAAPENTGMSLLVEDGRVVSWLKPNEPAPEGCEVFDAIRFACSARVYRYACAFARAGT